MLNQFTIFMIALSLSSILCNIFFFILLFHEQRRDETFREIYHEINKNRKELLEYLYSLEKRLG